MGDLPCGTRRTIVRLGSALAALAAAGLAGCSGPLYTQGRGQFEADQDIARSRFQLYTLEPTRYLHRDSESGLPVRPRPGGNTAENRAYISGYNARMLAWVGRHGRPGYNFAQGVPSDSEQLRIISAMNDPRQWVRLKGSAGAIDLPNGWTCRYRERDDGIYFVSLRSAPVELRPILTTPMILPLPDGRVVLVQLEDEPGSIGHAVLFDPQSPDDLFILQQ